jgi:hypothetical protein
MGSLSKWRRRLLVALARTPGLSTAVLRARHVRRYRRSVGRKPDLRRPRLFTEYILHRIVYDRDPLLKVASDKFAVRGWIDRVLGPGYAVPLLGAWQSADRIDWASLPVPFVIKPAHCSGPFHVVERTPEPDEIAKLSADLAGWLGSDFFDTSFEWGYKDLPRRILCEPLLRSPDGGPLIEVTVFVFHGQPRILLALAGHKHSAKDRCTLWLDENGVRSDIHVGAPAVEEVLGETGARRMAEQVEAVRLEMVELSRKVGDHFSYVRVDFYITDAGLKIGELTTYPVAGLAVYKPDDADARLGRMLRDSGLQRRDRGLAPFAWPPLD